MLERVSNRKEFMKTTLITRGGDGDLLIKVSGACQHIERFDELTAEERRDFAIRAIERGAVATVRLRTTDRARTNDAAQFASDAARSNPTLAPGADTERARRRDAERNSKLQAAYEGLGKEGRDARR